MVMQPLMLAPPCEPRETFLVRLKPQSVVDAARLDIKLSQRKVKDDIADMFAPYAFHRDHVAKAMSAAELIAIALTDLDRGTRSSKRNTRLIYGDKEILERALSIAKEYVDALDG